MKKNDIALLILASVGSVLIAYFLSDSIFGKPGDRRESVPTFNLITSDLAQPRDDIFNKNAINPTVEIEVGESQPTSENTQPAE